MPAARRATASAGDAGSFAAAAAAPPPPAGVSGEYAGGVGRQHERMLSRS